MQALLKKSPNPVHKNRPAVTIFLKEMMFDISWHCMRQEGNTNNLIATRYSFLHMGIMTFRIWLLHILNYYTCIWLYSIPSTFTLRILRFCQCKDVMSPLWTLSFCLLGDIYCHIADVADVTHCKRFHMKLQTYGLLNTVTQRINRVGK